MSGDEVEKKTVDVRRVAVSWTPKTNLDGVVQKWCLLKQLLDTKIFEAHLLRALDSIGDLRHQSAFLSVGQIRPYRVKDLGTCDVFDHRVLKILPARSDSFANCVDFRYELWYRKCSGVLKCSNDLQVPDRCFEANDQFVAECGVHVLVKVCLEGTHVPIVGEYLDRRRLWSREDRSENCIVRHKFSCTETF